MTRARRAVAVSCIALIVFAAFLPLGGVSLEWLDVASAFTLLPPLTSLAVPREAHDFDARPVPHLARLESRGPPSQSALA